MERLSQKEKVLLSAWMARVGGIRLDKVLFPVQLKFIESASSYVAALAGRQSGKSWAVAALMLHTALHTRKNVQFCALTRPSAKKIIWQKLIDLDRIFNLKCKFKEMALEVHTPDGAIIYISGLDNSPGEQQKIRGNTFKLVVVDEAGHYSQNLEEIVNDILEPTLKVEQGKLVLLGTPGNLLNFKNLNHQDHSEKKRNDFFYRVTEGMIPGWDVHKWTALDNPYMAEAEAKYRAKKIAENPLIVNTPSWKREVLGEWYHDDGLLAFKFSRENNVLYKNPAGGGARNDGMPGQDYIFSLGIDLGFKDATAFVVGAYGKSDNKFYIPEVFKSVRMEIDDIEKKIDYFRSKYTITGYYVDKNNIHVAHELNKRLGINMVSADSHEKYNFIQLLNHDFLLGNIKIMRSTIAGVITGGYKDQEENPLIQELENCIWDEDDPTEIYNGCQDHLIDALRYCWRHAYYYRRNHKEMNKTIENNISNQMDTYWAKKAKNMNRIRDNYVDLGGKNYL